MLAGRVASVIRVLGVVGGLRLLRVCGVVRMGRVLGVLRWLLRDGESRNQQGEPG